MKKGKVWLVGAGPSDPGLLTLKGKAVLDRADVVVYDRLVGDGILAMVPPDALKIDVGKNAGNHTMPQEEINALLVRHAQEGQKVVRLKGGDPFVYGRGGEEAQALVENGIAFEVVPGVTAASAVPAYFGIPVTHREAASSLHLITAHRKKGETKKLDYKTLAETGVHGPLVFYMGVNSVEEICSELIKAGMDPNTPAAILMRGTAADQKKIMSSISALPECAAREKAETPGLIVVGQVCRLSESLSWAEKRPLGGVRLFVTRPREKASFLSEQLSELGAEVIELPAIRTQFLEPYHELLEKKEKLRDYRWLICSSPVGTEAFFKFLQKERIDIRSLPELRFAAVGPKTRKVLEEKGILVECCPQKSCGEELAKELFSVIRPDDKLLALVPENRESAVVSVLRKKEVNVDTAAVYRTLFETTLIVPHLRSGDSAIFTSASSVEGFVKMVHESVSGLRAFCIGSQTANAARDCGMETIVAEQASMESLIHKVVEYYQTERL